MSLLKGIERCEYISDILDNTDYFIWSKDMNNNLLFANRPAFEMFKSLNDDNTMECPINVYRNENNKETYIGNIWVEYSSRIVSNGNGTKHVLMIARDITDKKKRDIEISKKLDERIVQWKEEERKRTERINKTNAEIFQILNLAKTEGVSI